MDQKIVYFLILAISSNGVVSVPQEDKIVGGNDAIPHSINFQVLLKIYAESGNSFNCGGSLISPRYVLTAAHCMVLKPPEIRANVFVVLGEHDTSDDNDEEVEILVTRVINHPNYNSPDFDFSILDLEKPVQLSFKVGYVCLAGKSFIDFSGKELTVSGWGHISFKGIFSNVLKVANLIGISNEECAKKYVGKPITDKMLCAANPSTDSCQGDSGGPLTVLENGKKVLVGVVSWGIGCANSNYPGVYARVSSVLDWILENTDVREQAKNCQKSDYDGNLEKPKGSVNWNGNDWAQNCDFFGNDLSNVFVPASSCGGQCANTLGCTHYTWTSYNGGICLMKKGGASKEDATFADGYVCGVNNGAGGKINWTGKWAFSCDFSGRDIGSAQVPGDQCSNTCQNTPGCTHFAWNPWTGGECWMKYGDVSKADAIKLDTKHYAEVVCGIL